MRPKFAAISRYRPRILTVVVLVLVAAVIVLANFTSEIVRDGPPSFEYNYKRTYGWPLIWHWHDLFLPPAGPAGIVDSDYSAARLAGNVALWLLMLAVPAGGGEWLLRRYRPGLRWSLRTMLATVAVAAVLCAWFAAACNRAKLQDSIIAELTENTGSVLVERSGPKWMEFILPDRFRRQIVGIRMSVIPFQMYAMTLDEELSLRLERLPRLKYLVVRFERWTPGMADALAGMRQLRWLGIERIESDGSSAEGEHASHDYLADIGKLSQLEELCLVDADSFSSGRLGHLAGLKNLKLLILYLGADSKGSISNLPALPQLEAIHIRDFEVSRQDLRHLAVLPRLKSLHLSRADVDGAEMTELASLKSLEELSIRDTLLSPQCLESLQALKRLKVLNIFGDESFGESDRTIAIALDDGDEFKAPEGEADRIRRALETLRQSNPGLVVKGNKGNLWRGYTFEIDAPFPHEAASLDSTWPPAWLPRLASSSASPTDQSSQSMGEAEE